MSTNAAGSPLRSRRDGGVLGQAPRWRHKLADAVWVAHVGITAFFLIAWALPWRGALWTALVAAVVMPLQWRLNGDVCVLTSLERMLRGVVPDASAVPEAGFIDELLASIAGRPLSKRWADRATYAVLWGGAGVAGLRLVWN